MANNNKAASWQHIFNEIKEKITDEEILKWIKDLKTVSIEANTITLEAPNKYIKMWVEDHYLDYLKEILKNAFHIIDANIKITLKGNTETEKDKASSSSSEEKEDKQSYSNDYYSVPLNKQYTFETFVAGKSNRFAYAACLNAAKGFERLNNPIYIHGDVGLGKTHLMHAVGNYMRVNFPKKNVLCVTGELYLREFLNSLKTNRLHEFNNKYEATDVLLFDDVQFISRGEATMEEFFFLFSKLYSNDKQIILTSNSLPDDIIDLDRRLSSRFQSGLIVEIGTPSVDEKIAIIENYLKINKYYIKDEVIKFVAENIKSDSTRDLLGVINTIVVKGQLYNVEVTVDYIQSELKNFFLQRDRVLSPNEIIQIVCDYYNIKLVDMQSKSRAVNIVIPRNMAIYLIYKNTPSSLASIGAIFKRDHSTIKNSINKIEKEIATNNDYTVNTLKELSNRMKVFQR